MAKCPMPPLHVSVMPGGRVAFLTYIPTMPIFFPGPAPFRTRGEYAVKPAQSIGAANSLSNASGIGNVKCSWARMWEE